MHQRTDPSPLRTSTVGAAQADEDGRMTPAANCSLRHFSSSSSNPLGVLLTHSLTGAAHAVSISCWIAEKCPTSRWCLAKARCRRFKMLANFWRTAPDGISLMLSWYSSRRCCGRSLTSSVILIAASSAAAGCSSGQTFTIRHAMVDVDGQSSLGCVVTG